MLKLLITLLCVFMSLFLSSQVSAFLDSIDSTFDIPALAMLGDRFLPVA